MRITEDDLTRLHDRFADASPVEILTFTARVFGDRAAVLTSMQKAGSVLCHMADRAGLALDVLFVDTGVLFAETLAARDELARTHPNLRVRTLAPERSMARQVTEEGVLYLSKEGQERCCDLRKSEPLRREKGRYDALVGALRAGEGGKRKAVRVFEIDEELSALRVHPLARASDADFARYLGTHPDVVVHPLHAMGYPTIGCFTCTTPVLPDEPERAGRWRHLAGVEYCGINPTDRDRGARAPSLELDDRYAAYLLT